MLKKKVNIILLVTATVAPFLITSCGDTNEIVNPDGSVDTTGVQAVHDKVATAVDVVAQFQDSIVAARAEISAFTEQQQAELPNVLSANEWNLLQELPKSLDDSIKRVSIAVDNLIAGIPNLEKELKRAEEAWDCWFFFCKYDSAEDRKIAVQAIRSSINGLHQDQKKLEKSLRELQKELKQSREKIKIEGALYENNQKIIEINNSLELEIQRVKKLIKNFKKHQQATRANVNNTLASIDSVMNGGGPTPTNTISLAVAQKNLEVVPTHTKPNIDSIQLILGKLAIPAKDILDRKVTINDLLLAVYNNKELHQEIKKSLKLGTKDVGWYSTKLFLEKKYGIRFKNLQNASSGQNLVFVESVKKSLTD